MELDSETTFGEWLKQYRSEHGGRGPHCGDAWVAGRESMRGEMQAQMDAFSRLQSEHSDLIEKERILEAQLAAERWRQNIPDMVIDGYVNYVIASKAIRIEAMPFHAWLAAGDRE